MLLLDKTIETEIYFKAKANNRLQLLSKAYTCIFQKYFSVERHHTEYWLMSLSDVYTHSKASDLCNLELLSFDKQLLYVVSYGP